MKQVIFIISAGHSGSTLLDLILGSHSSGHSLGELSSLNRNGVSVAGSLCGVCEGACPFWDREGLRSHLRSHFGATDSGRRRVLQALRRRLVALGSDLYGHLFRYAESSTFLVDSSKSLDWLKRQTRMTWHWRDKKPWLLYLHRDGRGVLASYLRKYPKRSVIEFAQSFKRQTEKRESFFESFPRSRRIRLSYESLTADPGTAVRQICRRLGVPFEAGMLRYWIHNHHPIHGNLGTRSLIFRYRRESGGGNQFERRWRTADRSDAADYRQAAFEISRDERWRSELTEEQLAEFERCAGKANAQLLQRAEKTNPSSGSGR